LTRGSYSQEGFQGVNEKCTINMKSRLLFLMLLDNAKTFELVGLNWIEFIPN